MTASGCFFARVRGGAAGKGGHQCNLASNAYAMTSTCPSPPLVVAPLGHVARVLLPLRFPAEEPPTLFRRLLALVCRRDCSSCGVSLPLPGFPPASLGSTAPRVPSSLCSRCWTHRWFSRQVLSSFACLVQLAGGAPLLPTPQQQPLAWPSGHPAQVWAAHTRACQDRTPLETGARSVRSVWREIVTAATTAAPPPQCALTSRALAQAVSCRRAHGCCRLV